MTFQRPRVVFAYDFDGTLAPGNMQEHAFIPGETWHGARGFLGRGKVLAKVQRGDPILAYMHLMLAKARARNIELTEQAGSSAAPTCRSFRRRGLVRAPERARRGA
jgi:hypothetical protein